MRDDNWCLKAACHGVDVELFYSEQEADIRAALALCRSCEVRATCFQVAVTDGEPFGIWGGVPESQRRRIMRRSLGQRSTAA